MKAHRLPSLRCYPLPQVLVIACLLIGYSVKLATADSDTGDLNMNGVNYEIADLVLYENYFIYGDAVLSPEPSRRQAQVRVSDVNQDGLTLRIADLVYMGRIINGDNNPLPKPNLSQQVTSADFQIVQESARLLVSYNSPIDLGGISLHLNFLGTAGDPVRLDSNPDMVYGSQIYPGEIRYMLVSDFFSSPPGKVPAGNGPLLSIPFSGNLRNVEIQVSDTSGQEVGSTGSFPIDNRGDLNADGTLAPADVVQELYCVFEISTASCSLSASDLNCDGMLTTADVVNILNAAFRRTAFPVCTF